MVFFGYVKKYSEAFRCFDGKSQGIKHIQPKGELKYPLAGKLFSLSTP